MPEDSDETGVYRDDDGQIYIDTDPNDDWSGREAAEEGSTDAGFDSGSSSSGGGGGGSSDRRTAEDFDPDDYPFARSVEELGEIRRDKYGLTDQERRRVERGEDPVPDGGEGFVVYDPEFSGGSGEVVGSGDTEAEAATATVRDRVSEARNTDGAVRFSEGLPFDVTDDEVERQQVRELENREQTLRQREQELQQTIDQLPEADRLNIEGTNLESEFGSSIVSRNELKGYFQDQRQRLQENREQVADQRENVRFELSQVQRPDRRQINTLGISPDPGEPLTGLVEEAERQADFSTDAGLPRRTFDNPISDFAGPDRIEFDANRLAINTDRIRERFRDTFGPEPDPREPMTGMFETDTSFGYQGPAVRGPGESRTMETGVEYPSGTNIPGTGFLEQQNIRAEEALNDLTDPWGERFQDFVGERADPVTEEELEQQDVEFEELSTGLQVFATGETIFSNPRDSAALTGAQLEENTPFDIPFFDPEVSSREAVEERIERDLAVEDRENQSIDPIDQTSRLGSVGGQIALSAPISRAVGAGVQGLRALGGQTAGRAGTAVLGGAGVGLAGLEAQEISRLENEGRDAEALGRTVGFSGEVAGAAQGIRSGLTDFAPRIGRSSEIDTRSFGTFVDENNVIGTGTGQGTGRIIRDRFLLPGQSNRPLDISTEFRFDADEAGTIAEGTVGLSGRNIDETVDFETVSRPIMEEDELTVTSDLTRTESEGVLFRDFEDFDGNTRQILEDVEEIDTVRLQGEEDFVEFPEQLERRQFGVFSRTSDGREVFGENEVFLPQRDTASGAAGGTQSFDGGLTAPNIQRGVLRGIQEANPNLGSIEGAGPAGSLAASEVSTGLEEVEGGSTASGVQGESDAIEAFRQEEMAVQGSPLEETESFTREPVSDRLLREPEGTGQIREAEETQLFDTRSSQDTQQRIEQDPLDPVNTGAQGPPTGLEEVTDPAATLTRGTTLFDPADQVEEPRTGLFGTQNVSTQQEQVEAPFERPLEEGVMGLTRGQVPQFREETGLFQGQQQGLATGLEESQDQMQQLEETGLGPNVPRGRGRAGRGRLPSPDLGFELGSGGFSTSQGSGFDSAFSPDLTGTLFGGGVSEGPVTGLERRNPNTGEEEEDNLFGDSRIL